MGIWKVHLKGFDLPQRKYTYGLLPQLTPKRHEWWQLNSTDNILALPPAQDAEPAQTDASFWSTAATIAVIADVHKSTYLLPASKGLPEPQ